MASPPSSSVSAPFPGSSSCATADFTRFPTSDVACAVGSTNGIPSSVSSVFDKCCKSAPVESFNGPCGYYCLAVQQSVAELQKCFQEEDITPRDIFCNAANSATASPSPTPTSSAKGTGASTTSTGGPAASGTQAPGGSGAAAHGVSKMGLGILGMVFVSVMAGVMV